MTILDSRPAQLERPASGPAPSAASHGIRNGNTAVGRDPMARLGVLFDSATLDLLQPADDSGVLTGEGLIDGVPAVAFASDPRVQGGAMGSAGCAAIVSAYDRALEIGAPVIGLWHSGGARLREGAESLHAVGTVFAAMTRASGKVPQISVVLGAAAGGAAYGPALTDLVILSDQGRIFVTGPDVVRSVTGEDVDMARLGGPEPHSRRSGVVHVVTPTDGDAIVAARELAVLLGRQQDDEESAPAARRRRLGRPAAGVTQARLRRAPADQRSPRCAGDRAAPALGAERGDHARQARRPDGRRGREQPAATRRLPGRDVGGEGRTFRAGCATRSACRLSSSWTCQATCPASGRSGTAWYAAARSCCTRSPRPWSRG